MTTIKDVAKAAGVSTATVSRVINNSSKVPVDKANKIREVINQVGYEIANNRRLGINKPQGSIGLLINEINSPYGGLVASGVEKVARKNGLKPIILTSLDNKDDEEENLQYLLDIGCKKIVVHYQSISDSTIEKYSKDEHGIVVLNRKIESMKNRCVYFDHEQGGYLATKRLLEKGHRGIAFLTSNINILDKTERYKGYLRALSEYNINANLDWLEEVPSDEHSIIVAVTNLMSKTSSISAIVAFNDFYASVTMQVLHDRGLRVPEDISVIGYDNVLPQCYFHPKLSTINFPIERMAMNAAILSICGEDSHVDRCFNSTFIDRETIKNLISKR